MKHLNRWVYVIVGVVTLLMAGLIYAWSVMSKTIGASYDWSAASLSLTFTLVMLFFCVGSLLAGIFSKKIKPRIYLILSAVLFLAGFLTASGTGSSLGTLYLGFGALCGLGAGFAYNAVMGTVCAWFPDKQGLISGILLMGFGLSSFIVGKVFAAATPPVSGSYAWTGTFRLMGIVIFVVMLICSIFMVRPGEDFHAPEPKKAKTVREPACDIGPGQMVKKPSFWLFYIWAIMVSAAGLALVGQASGIATQVGPQVDAGTIATVVGLISIMNGVGRVLMGAIFDKKGYRFTMVLDMIIFLITAGILVLAIRSGSFSLIVVGFVVGGLAYSGVTPIQSALISDFYGRTYYSTNFSIVVTNLLIGSFASTIAGKLYDMTQSYMSTILMMFLVTIVAFVVSIGVRRPVKEEA